MEWWHELRGSKCGAMGHKTSGDRFRIRERDEKECCRGGAYMTETTSGAITPNEMSMRLWRSAWVNRRTRGAACASLSSSVQTMIKAEGW